MKRLRGRRSDRRSERPARLIEPIPIANHGAQDGLAAQHQQLDRFVEEIALALERGDQPRADEVMRWFCSALEAHFTVEEEIVFAAVVGLDPTKEDAFRELREEHAHFRLHLPQVGRAIETRDPRVGLEVLERFAEQLRAHERREEQLLRTRG